MARNGIVITGATATGKTALSIEVARRLNGEIISMDSRQVYRGMDIGTAKATPEQRAQVPHHGLDLVNPDERYSAGRFARDARRWIADISGRGHVPVLVGGTGFFLKALLEPLFAEPPMPEDRREQLKRYLRQMDADRQRQWLQVLDPAAAARLAEQGGRQRISRAIEVTLLTGRPFSWWQQASPSDAQPLDLLVFVLEMPRDRLYATINQRVHDMIADGLVDEVRALVTAGYKDTDPGMNATGYIELLPFLEGKIPLEDAIDAIQRATRRYARRQLTWFRHQPPADAIRLGATAPLDSLAAAITEQWKKEVGSAHRN